MTARHRGRRPWRARPAGDRGAVTAELAVGMVAVAVVLLAVLATAAAGVAQLRCLDAARTGARVAALGEDDASAVAAARRALAGRAADVHVTRADGWVTVRVEAPFAGWSGPPGLRARASATSWAEPTSAPAVGTAAATAATAAGTAAGTSAAGATGLDAAGAVVVPLAAREPVVVQRSGGAVLHDGRLARRRPVSGQARG